MKAARQPNSFLSDTSDSVTIELLRRVTYTLLARLLTHAAAIHQVMRKIK
jgi:hypothetical protein